MYLWVSAKYVNAMGATVEHLVTLMFHVRLKAVLSARQGTLLMQIVGLV